MTNGFLSAENTIDEYGFSQDLKAEYHSLYMYALYLCGGDFGSFDEPLILEEAIMNTEEKFKLF